MDKTPYRQFCDALDRVGYDHIELHSAIVNTVTDPRVSDETIAILAAALSDYMDRRETAR